jgi:Tol biopolymer transport system component
VKAFTYLVLLVAMCAFGFGVYRLAGSLKADGAHAQRPSSTHAEALPGTMYVAQDGAIYKLRGGTFTQITEQAGWTQPSPSPDGSELVAVQRHLEYSDIYLLSPNGRVQQQLTHFQSSPVEANHWAFEPRFSPDGNEIFYAYDNKITGTYQVDLSILAMRADGSGSDVVWTVPNQYTGGDTDPVPLRGGGLVYTKYSIDDQGAVHSQVWITSRPGALGASLTKLEEDCAQPAVSPDEKSIAMICRHGQLQSTELVMATFDPVSDTLGPETALVQGQLAASPVFSPDGQTIAFLAPVQEGESFQLWTVPAAASPSPSAARPVTQNVGLDSSAAPVWEPR